MSQTPTEARFIGYKVMIKFRGTKIPMERKTFIKKNRITSLDKIVDIQKMLDSKDICTKV